MQSRGTLRYRPVENGYEIIGSREIFNRTLYGSHAQDNRVDRYFTFAGDLPLFMGAVTDWSRHQWCKYAKCGVLMSGLALTPGHKTNFFYSADIDISSQWFHNAEDVVAVFRNGWMEYELRQLSAWMPETTVAIAVFPLMPDDGFLVHYRITPDQRIIFCAGLGGLTEPLGRFEYAKVRERQFRAEDCRGNTVHCQENRARIAGSDGTCLWVGSSFPVTVDTGDAAAMETCDPGMFLGRGSGDVTAPVARISCLISAGQTLDGFLVVLRNAAEDRLDYWLGHKDPTSHLKQEIRRKHAAITVHTPDAMLNQTVPPTVLAMDASWQKNTFYHGAYAYHAPFLGWRNWYGPTVLGWHDRVRTAITTHFSKIIKQASGEERVWYDGQDRPDLDHEGTQYHRIENTTGRIPALRDMDDIYNMQEVALDMVFHYLEWTNDLALARERFEDLKGVLDWEERILDPDRDGLYQDFLNTWISDGHSHNGGGCAQSSAYNYAAHRMMAKLASKLGHEPSRFMAQAEKIREAVNRRLWLPARGVLAEFVDTLGHKQVHPSPELSTIYLAIDCGLVDPFQAYQMLRFTETALRNERTLNRNGRLVYSSNWRPKKYSTCGLYPAENLHLALVYYKLGLKEKAAAIMDAIVDSYFTGKNPGMAAHILTAHGVSDGGDQDFSDVSSMYLRVIVEGLFGIRLHLLDDRIEIAPGFPADWTHAALTLKDLALNYHRDGRQEDLTFHCRAKAARQIRLPLRSTRIESVLLNGDPVEYRIEAAVDRCFLVVDAGTADFFHLQVTHGDDPVPALTHASAIVVGNTLVIETSHGTITDYRDPSGTIQKAEFADGKWHGAVTSNAGHHTVFVRVRADQFGAWLPADFRVEAPLAPATAGPSDKDAAARFEPVDISRHFNCSLDQIHRQQYSNPRPDAYSIGVRINGRYAWDWNHAGHNAVRVDDTVLRQSKGLYRTPSGIGFAVPEAGPNVACASLWDNFPTALEIPLTGRGRELAAFLIGVTNPMQNGVINARLVVTYRDGARRSVELVHPENFDDWLNAALQTENETVYFSEYNHGMVQRIALDAGKELAALSVEAVANEVIVGVLGLSIRRS